MDGDGDGAGHGQGSRADPGQGGEEVGDGDASRPPAQGAQRRRRRHRIGGGEGQCQALHPEPRFEGQGQDDVEPVLEQIEEEGRAGVVEAVEAPKGEQVEREGQEAEGEGDQGAGGEVGRGRREGAPLEQEGDHGPGEEHVAGRRRQDHQGHEAQAEGELAAEPVQVTPAGGPGQLGGERRHQGHGHQPMGELEEHVGAGVGRDAAGDPIGQHEHEPECQLVGGHVARRPPRQPHQLPDGRVAPVEHGPKPDPGAAQRREERDGHGGDPGSRAQAEQPQQPGVVAYALEGGRTPGQMGQGQENGGDEHVVEDRGEGGGGEAAVGIEQRRGEGRQPVEEHLGHEQPQEGGGHLLLGGSRGRLQAEGVQADDRRGGQDSDGGEGDEEGARHGHHGRGGLVVAPVAVVDEDGHEGGRQDAAEEELVDDVGSGVGQVVRVGQAGEAEGVGHGGQAGNAGEARQGRAQRHRGTRPENTGGCAHPVWVPSFSGDSRPGSVTFTSVSSGEARSWGWAGGVRGRSRRLCRRVRRRSLPHHTSKKRPAPAVRVAPTPLTTVDRMVSLLRLTTSCPSGEVTVMTRGKAPGARVSTAKLSVVFCGGRVSIRSDPPGKRS